MISTRGGFSRWLVLGMALALAGCGGGDGGGLSNKNPGNNDLNVVVAFGDSITQGSECPCAPYPSRLSGLIGKTVYNTGVGGSTASGNVGRTQDAINRYHPAFMLILYGVNDIIMSESAASAVSAVNQMVAICKQNNVVPVLQVPTACSPAARWPSTRASATSPGRKVSNASIWNASFPTAVIPSCPLGPPPTWLSTCPMASIPTMPEPRSWRSPSRICSSSRFPQKEGLGNAQDARTPVVGLYGSLGAGACPVWV